jgi:hypothetical protein
MSWKQHVEEMITSYLLITRSYLHIHPSMELHFTPKKVGDLEYLGFQKFSDFLKIMADKFDPKGNGIVGHQMQRILWNSIS